MARLPSMDMNDEIRLNNMEQGLHVVAKPMGPVCNLNCEYCFYLEKKVLFAPNENFRMPEKVLSGFITNYITSQPTPVVEFVWQGGEPTLLGLDFFRQVVKEQKPYTKKKTIRNSLQTNGTLLTDEWCRFLKKNDFIVGISLDGPEEIHDRYRRDRKGNGTFEKVMHGLRLLKEHDVKHNVLACIGRDTADQPLDVYRFFRDERIEFVQFTPVVECMPDDESRRLGLRLAVPHTGRGGQQTKVAPFSVDPIEYADFLIAIYDEWVRHDVGKVFVMNFEWALNAWLGNPSPVCIHAEQCGRSLVIEHNGDVYACDHCVYPQYRLGNILTAGLSDMVDKSIKSGFGVTKEKDLSRQCRECGVLRACRGGCPKHRFSRAGDDGQSVHYLCEGYKKFFSHIAKYLKVMATLLENNLPASLVMDAVKGPLVINLDGK
jgi:uncharacterized protein